MGYQLGIDLGTTYTAAAVARGGRVEVAALGTASPVIPSVVLLRADGEVLVGEVAVRRGQDEPTRVAREFKRRLGDPTPLVLGGTPYGAEALTGHLLRSVVRAVAEREGSAPDRVVLTHPANYGPYKLDMMREVARLAGLDLATTAFITEPQAAAISYAQRNRVEPGDVVAVYDFGGGTFDAALLQRRDEGFVLIGRPEGMERFGGIDIDAAILNHIDVSLDGAIRALDPDDPTVIAAVSRLKDECRQAKEALAADTDTSIAVNLPTVQTRIRLTRRELEDMIRPRLTETLEALDRAVRSAGLTMDQVSRILLVGGSSRMPLVSATLQRETGRPVAVDAHPKYAIALGAAAFGTDSALIGGSSPTTAPVAVPPPPPARTPAAPVPPAPAAPAMTPTVAMPAAPAPTVAMPQTPPVHAGSFQAAPAAPPARPDKRKLYIIGGAAAAAVLAIVAFVATRGDDSPKGAVTTDSVPVETDAPNVTESTAPVVDPVVSVNETTSTQPPETAPPETTPPAQPLTPDQLQFALVTPAEVQSTWVQGVFEAGDFDVCNAGFVDNNVGEQGVLFTRTVSGQLQSLTNAVSTYVDSATALATIAAFSNALTSCTQFDQVDPASGQTLTFFPQATNDIPAAGCQAAVSLRIDSMVAATGAPLASVFSTVQVCGNNSASAAFAIPVISGVLPQDQIAELSAVLTTSINKLITLPVVP
jgi:molecular chaperone DnaK